MRFIWRGSRSKKLTCSDGGGGGGTRLHFTWTLTGGEWRGPLSVRQLEKLAVQTFLQAIHFFVAKEFMPIKNIHGKDSIWGNTFLLYEWPGASSSSLDKRELFFKSSTMSSESRVRNI